MKVIHKDCNKSQSKDKSLPINSYLVTYHIENKFAYDIVQASSFTEVFDNYWDQYREDLKKIIWTDGRVNPKLYGFTKSEEKKGKR